MESHLFTDYTVNTVLLCIHCRRIQVFRGEGCWFDIGKPPSGSNCIIAPFITSCSRCGKDNISTNISTSDLYNNFKEEITYATTHLDGTLIVPIVTDDSRVTIDNPITIAPEAYDMKGEPQTFMTHIDDIMKRIYCESKVNSLSENALGEPHSNFIDNREPFKLLCRSIPTPFPVNSVLFCAGCKRNIIFTGYVITYALDPVTLISTFNSETPELSRMFFVTCKRCNDLLGINDGNVVDHIAAMMLRGDMTMPKLREYFSNKLKTVKTSDGPSSHIDIMHRDRMVSALYYHCNIWSINTTKSEPVKGAIPNNFI